MHQFNRVTAPDYTRHGERTNLVMKAIGAESALLHRHDPASFPLTEAGRGYAGFSILEMAKDVLEAGGISVRGLSAQEVAGLALQTRAGGGMMSTSDFPNILANVANKSLRKSYESAPATWKPITRVVTVPDFKPVSRVMLGEAPTLEKVNEHGEFKRGTMGESREAFSLSTYGKILAISRQSIVDDDLSAFTRIPAAFGIQAANLISDLVWSIVLANAAMGDGAALFSTTHKNLIATGAAIDTAGVAASRKAMNVQTGLDNSTLLNITPSFLIVPSALQTVAEQFVGQIFPTKNTDTVPESLRRLQVIAEPRLDNGVTFGGVTYSGSASNWYLAANPNQIDIIEIGQLEGADGPYLETRDGFDVDGLSIKCRIDVGAAAIDFRGLLKNTAP